MIRVSASAFDILWTDLGHDRPPEPLSVRSVGSTEEERAEVRKAVYDNLAERGLYDGSALEPALAERLSLLASAEVFVACEAMVDMTASAPFRAVTGVRGRRGVLATQPEQTIALAAIRDAELCTAIIDVLPELTAGPGYGVSLRRRRWLARWRTQCSRPVELLRRLRRLSCGRCWRSRRARCTRRGRSA